MDKNEKSQLVDAWIKYQYADTESPWKEQLLWSEHKLWKLTENEPDAAWSIILLILEKDNSDKILQNLSAGPLEDLLCDHGKLLIERIEKEAVSNAAFRKLLGGVWKNEIDEDVWNRLNAIASDKW